MRKERNVLKWRRREEFDSLERNHGVNLGFQLEVVSRDECGGGVWSGEFRSSGSMERSTTKTPLPRIWTGH
jgi:hypothetical protein